MSRVERKQQSRKHKRRWKIIIVTLLIILLTVAGYSLYLYMQLDNSVSAMYTPLEDDIRTDLAQKQINNNETLNVLLLGVDEREGDVGRSDTMVFLSLNPKTEEMLMLSIPRDTRVEIPGRGHDKINHAYAFGGSELAVQTAENFLDTTIHYYARVNMEGLQAGVDALGGITVKNDTAFQHGPYTFEEGNIELNGEEALGYSRMRKGDPQGDIGRNDRQQQVIQAMLDEASSLSSFFKVDNIMQAAGDNVQTNMQMKQMRKLFTEYRQTRQNIEREEIEGHGEMMSDIWYYIVSEEERIRIQDVILDHS